MSVCQGTASSISSTATLIVVPCGDPKHRSSPFCLNQQNWRSPASVRNRKQTYQDLRTMSLFDSGETILRCYLSASVLMYISSECPPVVYIRQTRA
jgi:hypothetical protein